MWRFAVLGVLAVLLAGCGERLPTYRYKLTVEVDTPEGVRTGSAVREVRSGISGSIPAPGSVRRAVAGEAVAVDLPNGETLFALLIEDQSLEKSPRILTADAGHVAQYVFMDRIKTEPGFVGGSEAYKSYVAALSTRTYRAEVPRQFYPQLVRFDDITDPTSVEAVDADDLSASFGEGYALRRIVVETTDETVTRNIEEWLKWLPRIYELGIGSEFNPEGIPIGDFRGLFTKGDDK
ncbi:MAG: hypothetical protein AAF205_12610 [Pseudomonadota bacterium]